MWHNPFPQWSGPGGQMPPQQTGADVDWAALAQAWMQNNAERPPQPPELMNQPQQPPMPQQNWNNQMWNNNNWNSPQFQQPQNWQGPPQNFHSHPPPEQDHPPPPPPDHTEFLKRERNDLNRDNINNSPYILHEDMEEARSPAVNHFPDHRSFNHPRMNTPPVVMTPPHHNNDSWHPQPQKPPAMLPWNNSQWVGPSRGGEPTQNMMQASFQAMDMAKKKALPAWIREGLEKMEQEKLKKENQLRQENEEFQNKTSENPNKSKFESASEESDAELPEAPASEPSDAEGEKEEETPPQPLTEEELMLKVRRMLTEILLGVTNEEIKDIANEVHTSASRKEAKKAISRRLSSANQLGIISGYGSDDEESEEETKSSDNSDSEESEQEEVLEGKIQQKIKNFNKNQFERIKRLEEEEFRKKNASVIAKAIINDVNSDSEDETLKQNIEVNGKNLDSPIDSSIIKDGRATVKVQNEAQKLGSNDNDQYEVAGEQKRAYSSEELQEKTKSRKKLKDRKKSRSRSRSKEKLKSKHEKKSKDRRHSRSNSCDRRSSKHQRRSRSRSREYGSSHKKTSSRYRRSRSRERHRSRERSHSRDRYSSRKRSRSRDRHRGRSHEKTRTPYRKRSYSKERVEKSSKKQKLSKRAKKNSSGSDSEKIKTTIKTPSKKASKTKKKRKSSKKNKKKKSSKKEDTSSSSSTPS
uniref:Arginine/serine-rich protein PNISR n=2 Tax=Ciona intestinalis TaxID=7719 RepID=F6YUZ1_CIOIN